MTAKLLFSTAFFFIGSQVLSAQSFAVLHTEQVKDFGAFNAVRILEQNALLALIGAVILISLIWVCSILKACVQMDKPQKKAQKPAGILLVLITALSVFCGSCSVEQRARAAAYRTAQAAEARNCPLRHHYHQMENIPYLNHNGYTGYLNQYGPSFCKYCGYRLRNGN